MFLSKFSGDQLKLPIFKSYSLRLLLQFLMILLYLNELYEISE
jgi:hypothetical protein